MDGFDLCEMLQRSLPFDRVIDGKVRRAAEIALPFTRLILQAYRACPSRKSLSRLLRPVQERCGSSGVSLRRSAIRLSSGRERAFIFRIKLVRCTFTVD